MILSSNKIEKIDVLEKVNFPILQELKLSNNKIKDINAFEEVKFRYSLQRLHLSHNCLMISLKELYLAGNYLNKNSYEIIYLKEHIKKVII